MFNMFKNTHTKKERTKQAGDGDSAAVLEDLFSCIITINTS